MTNVPIRVTFQQHIDHNSVINSAACIFAFVFGREINLPPHVNIGIIQNASNILAKDYILRGCSLNPTFRRYYRTQKFLVPLGTVHVDDQQPNALGVYGMRTFVPYYSSNISVDLICPCFIADGNNSMDMCGLLAIGQFITDGYYLYITNYLT